MPRFNLVFQGFLSGEKMYEHRIPGGIIGEHQTQALLQRLVCHHLTQEEIVAASLRRDAKLYVPRLELSRLHSQKYGWQTAGNPYYIVFSEEAPD